MNSPLVSVIIPTYKRCDTLSRAIDSVLSQDYKNVEILVVDDNNPDTEYRKATEELMSSYQGVDQVIYLKHEKNKNGSAARNTGFRSSKGEYIMFLDDDDEFLPGKIRAQVECLETRDKSWGFCYTSTIRKRGDKVVAKTKEKQEGDIRKDALARDSWIFGGSNFMVRRSVMIEVGGFDESFKRNQDEEFLVKTLIRYKIAYVDMVGLCVYVGSENRKSTDFDEVTNRYLSTFRNQIEQLSKYEQDEVYHKINLQLYRYYLTKGYWGKAVNLIFKRKISFIDSINYLLYLLSRFIYKEDRCYHIVKHIERVS